LAAPLRIAAALTPTVLHEFFRSRRAAAPENPVPPLQRRLRANSGLGWLARQILPASRLVEAVRAFARWPRRSSPADAQAQPSGERVGWRTGSWRAVAVQLPNCGYYLRTLHSSVSVPWRSNHSVPGTVSRRVC